MIAGFADSGGMVVWHPRQPGVERAVELRRWKQGSITITENDSVKIYFRVMRCERARKVLQAIIAGSHRKVKNLQTS